jgi:GNAT superfamily N-acetyltransferase
VPRFSDPAPLGREHQLAGFDCGVSSLNIWLIDHARGAAGAGSARTYAIVDAEQGRVVGYHALTAASITHQEATERVRKGMPRYPIPAVLLARLAVDRSVQGQGLGALLLQDAMVRGLVASEKIGARLLLAHALDKSARDFYVRFGFEPSPTDPHNVQILMKDVRASLEAARG